MQSGSDKILASMNRKYTKEQYLNLINKIKDKIPDAEFTTDIIVGFPGETEEDFNETIDVIKKVEYMQIFGFLYSKRKGTVAEKMKDQIDTKTKKERLSKLLAVKNEIVNRMCQNMLGKTYSVLVESYNENGVLYGSLDSGKTITFKGSKNCVGEFVDVKVIQVRKSVLYGEIVDDERIKDFKEKSFKNPLEVSILPKDQKSMKLLRENKNKKKLQNDFKSKN